MAIAKFLPGDLVGVDSSVTQTHGLLIVQEIIDDEGVLSLLVVDPSNPRHVPLRVGVDDVIGGPYRAVN